MRADQTVMRSQYDWDSLYQVYGMEEPIRTLDFTPPRRTPPNFRRTTSRTTLATWHRLRNLA